MNLNATSSSTPIPASFWKYGLIVFLAVILLSLPQTALIPLLDRDEPRFAEASREMLQSGNFIVPTFNHAPRYNKPPMIYWCQAVSFTFFGENAFAARLPSVLATAGTAFLLFMWAAQLGSGQMALGTALSYAFCFQTIQQGRVATADGLLIFFMTLTVFAGWKVLTTSHASQHARSYFWDTILALGFAGGFLAKGPEALLPILPMLVCARGMRKNIMGELLVNFLIGLVIVLFWAVPAYIMTNGDYWRVGMSEGVGERMVSGLQGHGASSFGWYLLSVPLYLLLFWISALPWSPLLIIYRKKLFSSWKPDVIDTYLLLNAGLIFLVFSFMVTKLPHYTLPAFPFISLLLARRWVAAELHPKLPTQLAGGLGIVFALLTAVLVPVALIHQATPSPAGLLVREAGNQLTPGTEFALVDFQEPNAIWEMRRVCKGYGQSIPEDQVFAFMNQPGPRAVIFSSSGWERISLQALNDNQPLPWKIYSARGWNTAKGWDSKQGSLAFIDLTLVVKLQ